MFVAHDANRGESVKLMKKAIENGDINCMSRFLTAQIGWLTVPITSVMGYKYIAVFDG